MEYTLNSNITPMKRESPQNFFNPPLGKSIKRRHFNFMNPKRDCLTREIYQEMGRLGRRNKKMYEYLGDYRANRSYPDQELENLGYMQTLPLRVQTPFKWLLKEPFYLDLGTPQKFMFFHTQKEGGRDWLGSDIECRDLFILLKRQQDGSFVEVNSLLIMPFNDQEVYRIKELHLVKKDLLETIITFGTYNVLKEKKCLFQVDEKGFTPIK